MTVAKETRNCGAFEGCSKYEQRKHYSSITVRKPYKLGSSETGRAGRSLTLDLPQICHILNDYLQNIHIADLFNESCEISLSLRCQCTTYFLLVSLCFTEFCAVCTLYPRILIFFPNTLILFPESWSVICYGPLSASHEGNTREVHRRGLCRDTSQV